MKMAFGVCFRSRKSISGMLINRAGYYLNTKLFN